MSNPMIMAEYNADMGIVTEAKCCDLAQMVKLLREIIISASRHSGVPTSDILDGLSYEVKRAERRESIILDMKTVEAAMEACDG